MAGDPVVVDTNVGVVANLKAQASSECALECIRVLRAITREGHLVLDAEGRIFAEYIRYMSLAGQPGTGDVFVRWVADNRYNADLCTLVPLTDAEDESYVEFPSSDDLAAFDPSDRKFVAAAAAHAGNPEIVVALDRGWIRFSQALAATGITLQVLCPNDIGS